MVSRGFYAVQNTVLPMIVSSIAALCSVPLYWLFLQRSGAQGIALVGSLFMIAQFVVLTAIWTKRYHAAPELNQLLRTLTKIFVVSLAGSAVCFGIATGLGRLAVVQGAASSIRNLLVLSASGLPAVLLIFVVFDRLKIADFRATVRRIFRKEG